MAMWIQKWQCGYRNGSVDIEMTMWIQKWQCGYRNGNVDTERAVWIKKQGQSLWEMR